MGQSSMTYKDNYVYTAQLDLDLSELKLFCESMETVIIEKWGNQSQHLYQDSSITTSLHSYYNFLLFPDEQLHTLYLTIQNMFNQIRAHKGSYYISMWLNIHGKKEFLNWHSHNKSDNGCYHGYFTVNAEPSTTMYRLKDGSNVDVINKNNQLVISRSDGDLHCVTPWDGDDNRITLAFDIVTKDVAYNTFEYQNRTNNWVPI
jgi:hypothetical protein